MSDEELMERFSRTGDLPAFNAIVEKYEGQILRYFRRRGQQHANALDLTQNVFLCVVKFKHLYEPGRTVASWLFSIATNQMIDGHRVATRQRRCDSDASTMLLSELERGGSTFDIPESTSKDIAIQDIGVEMLRTLVSRLPDDERLLIEAVYFRGLSWSEAAKRLNLSPGTTHRRMVAGLQRLRRWLTQQETEAA